MDDKERKISKEMYARMVKLLTEDIEKAKVENDEIKKMQDFVVEKITVETILAHKIPSIEFVLEGVKHYCNLGLKISRNDVLVKLMEEATRLKDITDPEKIKEIQENYEKHRKEILAMVKPLIKVVRPRF